MTYFADLTPHTYTPTDGMSVLNVGWLDKSNTFRQGSTSPEFQVALGRLCQNPVHLHRGYHCCQFCPVEAYPPRHPSECTGNGQIRVLGQDGIWYAAPTLIHHYVVSHKYQPPPEFIEAVLLGVIDDDDTRNEAQ